MEKPVVGIVGLGLIGTSLARSLFHAGFARELWGYDLRPEHRQQADSFQVLKVVSEIQDLAHAQILVLATPVSAMGQVLQDLAPHLASGAIVTDVGSMKRAAIAQLEPHLPNGVRMVPAHPIAGLERHGPINSRDNLFAGHHCVLVPYSPDAVQSVREMWEAVGMRVSEMSAEQHDEVLAMTSHLPHLLSYAMATASAPDGQHLKLSAGSFRDFTRIAASDPHLWANILFENRDALLTALSRFKEAVSSLEQALHAESDETLEALLARSQADYLGKIVPMISR